MQWIRNATAMQLQPVWCCAGECSAASSAPATNGQGTSTVVTTNGSAAGASKAPTPAKPTTQLPLRDPLAANFKATAVIGISGKATPVYRTNDPFTFKVNDFKLPSDLVRDGRGFDVGP